MRYYIFKALLLSVVLVTIYSNIPESDKDIIAGFVKWDKYRTQCIEVGGKWIPSKGCNNIN